MESMPVTIAEVKPAAAASIPAPFASFDPIMAFFTALDDADARQADRDQPLYLDYHENIGTFEDMPEESYAWFAD